MYTASTPVEAGDAHRLYLCGACQTHGWYLSNSWQVLDRWKRALAEEGIARISYVEWPRWRLFGYRADPDGIMELRLGRIAVPFRLFLNYECEGGGSVRVEVPGAPDRSVEDAIALTGSSLGAPAVWRTGETIRAAFRRGRAHGEAPHGARHGLGVRGRARGSDLTAARCHDLWSRVGLLSDVGVVEGKYDLDMVRLPQHVKGKSGQVIHTPMLFAIYKKGKNKQQAIDFLSWFLTNADAARAEGMIRGMYGTAKLREALKGTFKGYDISMSNLLNAVEAEKNPLPMDDPQLRDKFEDILTPEPREADLRSAHSGGVLQERHQERRSGPERVAG